MLDLREQDWQTLKNILQKYPYTFYAFGSRVKNKAKKFSDLDLCYKESIPDAEVSKILEEFEESNLPFKVELLNWENCASDFKKEIEDDLFLLTFK